MLVATGASNMSEVTKLINKIKTINNHIVLMQCNTNYTASSENFKYIHLNVLKTYAKLLHNDIEYFTWGYTRLSYLSGVKMRLKAAWDKQPASLNSLGNKPSNNAMVS